MKVHNLNTVELNPVSDRDQYSKKWLIIRCPQKYFANCLQVGWAEKSPWFTNSHLSDSFWMLPLNWALCKSAANLRISSQSLILSADQETFTRCHKCQKFYFSQHCPTALATSIITLGMGRIESLILINIFPLLKDLTTDVFDFEICQYWFIRCKEI